MNITLILFLIGILGFVLNRKNIILMLISIEIMLLAITFLILVSSLNIDDIIGQTYAIYIIAVAGAESAIGLGILVAFYRFINSPVKNPRSKSSYSHFNSLPTISPCNFTISRNFSSVGKLRLPRKPEASFSLHETCESKIVLNPSFISGFSDAEGSFVVTILKNPRYKIG
jgi:NADH-ubiquinone oxidoreductase chain 4L